MSRHLAVAEQRFPAGEFQVHRDRGRPSPVCVSEDLGPLKWLARLGVDSLLALNFAFK